MSFNYGCFLNDVQDFVRLMAISSDSYNLLCILNDIVHKERQTHLDKSSLLSVVSSCVEYNVVLLDASLYDITVRSDVSTVGVASVVISIYGEV